MCDFNESAESSSTAISMINSTSVSFSIDKEHLVKSKEIHVLAQALRSTHIEVKESENVSNTTPSLTECASESSFSIMTGEVENVDMEDGKNKLGIVWNLLRRMSSVKDIASVRMSLPANLLEPQSNLEFWNYNDRPDFLASISDGEDEVERMIRVVKWFLAKDTKWKDNKLRKPYNPILGETFICHWEVPQHQTPTFADSEMGLSSSVESTGNSNNTTTSSTSGVVRVDCLTEQILHHPPISAFVYHCPAKRIYARGVDHVSAKFTGTAIKVGAGSFNGGVYLTIYPPPPTPSNAPTGLLFTQPVPLTSSASQDKHEEYNMTYPWASINGWLTKPYITVSETCVVVCPNTKLKCVILYKEEPFFTSAKFEIEGKIFRYSPTKDATLSERELRESEKLNKIPDQDVVATISGAWNGKIFARRVGKDTTDRLLFDLQDSTTHSKLVSPISEQAPNESRRLWDRVSNAILNKDYAAATAAKRDIENTQRVLAAEKKAIGAPAHVPRFFRFVAGRGGLDGYLGSDAFFHMDDKLIDSSEMLKGKPYLVERVNN